MLDRILGPLPGRQAVARYADAGELAADLHSCRVMLRVQRDLPPGYFVTPLAVRYPFLVGLFLVLFPTSSPAS